MSFTLCYLHSGSVADNSRYDPILASVFPFSSLLPNDGVSLFVHGLRQILVMSEQLLGLNRWWSFTAHNI